MEGGFWKCSYMSEQKLYRLVEEKDYGRICEIFNENIADGSVTLWNKSFTIADLQHLFGEFGERERAYVAIYKDQIVGWAMIKKYHEKEGYSATCETSLFLDRAYINQGHGTAFKKYIISQCKILDYHHIHAKILARNKISIAYNLKLGYSIVGVQREVGKINGDWVDVVIMQLLI